MEALIILIAFVAGLVALDVLAMRVGVDSRPGSTDPRGGHEPIGLR